MISRITPDSGRCKAAGELLATLRIKNSFFERPFLKAPLPGETRISMLFNAVAICHQTHRLESKMLNLTGWEYMEYGFLKLAESNSWLLDPLRVAEASAREVSGLLLRTFSDDGTTETSTLDRIEERVELYIDMSKIIAQFYEGKFSNLLAKSNGVLLSNNGKSFYGLLEKFEAFKDPVRKKSSFLFKLLYDAGLFEVSDTENFIPIMDYHMQRVLLRMGCLTINDEALETQLLSNTEVPSDEPVRSACIEALRLIAGHSGHSVWAMNDFFWPLGRSCCNETTLCTDHFCIKSPCTFFQMTEISDHSHCSFEACCRGFSDPKYRLFREPNVKTHYY